MVVSEKLNNLITLNNSSLPSSFYFAVVFVFTFLSCSALSFSLFSFLLFSFLFLFYSPFFRLVSNLHYLHFLYVFIFTFFFSFLSCSLIFFFLLF